MERIDSIITGFSINQPALNSKSSEIVDKIIKLYVYFNIRTFQESAAIPLS